MGASRADDRIAHRLAELQQALAELSQMLDRSYAPHRSREPTLMFPFSLLQQIITWGLDRLNRAVGSLVQRIIR